MSTPRDRVVASIESARLELEQALEEVEHLPAFDARSLSYAAHALSNYLMVTTGAVELLRQSIRDDASPQTLAWLDSLQHVTALMTHTASQLMGGSTASGGVHLRREPVNLPLLLQRCCQFYQRIADRKQIQLDLESQPDTPDVLADRVAVAAVIDNLLSNALKFSPRGTTVRVRIKAEGAQVGCHICDQGPGLTNADREQLFQRGATLSARPTAGEPTSGFGLAVAKDLMNQMGGQIWCRSEPGQGACFSMTFPTYAPPRAPEVVR